MIHNLNDYQSATSSTKGDDSLTTLALGLCGESGEVADIIKKVVGHGHTMDMKKLIAELGDCLWYIARLADANGVSLSEVAESNIEKLRKRYPNGFNSHDSINRKPEK